MDLSFRRSFKNGLHSFRYVAGLWLPCRYPWDFCRGGSCCNQSSSSGGGGRVCVRYRTLWLRPRLIWTRRPPVPPRRPPRAPLPTGWSVPAPVMAVAVAPVVERASTEGWTYPSGGGPTPHAALSTPRTRRCAYQNYPLARHEDYMLCCFTQWEALIATRPGTAASTTTPTPVLYVEELLRAQSQPAARLWLPPPAPYWQPNDALQQVRSCGLLKEFKRL
jgi:hypothetical protein